MTTTRLPPDDTTRAALTQDTVFIKFLAERLADSRRDAERLQSALLGERQAIDWDGIYIAATIVAAVIALVVAA